MLRRVLDIAIAGSTLLLIAPVFALIAAAIKIDSRGGVFYLQVRVGRNGVPFKIMKFRTMVDSAPTVGSGITTSRDPRITRVGRFLRRSKLDEIPQLFNVLKGEMSVVGPRPDVPEVVATYTPEMRRILSVRPGITSVASLDLSDEEALLALALDAERFYLHSVVPAKVALAMHHVDDRTVRSYLSVLLATGWKLIKQAFGVPCEGGLTSQLRSALLSNGLSGRADGLPLDAEVSGARDEGFTI